MGPIDPPERLPVCLEIPDGLSPERTIFIEGRTHTNALWFEIRLQCGSSTGLSFDEDIPFRFRVKFRDNGTRYNVNSFINGRWADEEKLRKPEKIAYHERRNKDKYVLPQVILSTKSILKKDRDDISIKSSSYDSGITIYENKFDLYEDMKKMDERMQAKAEKKKRTSFKILDSTTGLGYVVPIREESPEHSITREDHATSTKLLQRELALQEASLKNQEDKTAGKHLDRPGILREHSEKTYDKTLKREESPLRIKRHESAVKIYEERNSDDNKKKVKKEDYKKRMSIHDALVRTLSFNQMLRSSKPKADEGKRKSEGQPEVLKPKMEEVKVKPGEVKIKADETKFEPDAMKAMPIEYKIKLNESKINTEEVQVRISNESDKITPDEIIPDEVELITGKSEKELSETKAKTIRVQVKLDDDHENIEEGKIKSGEVKIKTDEVDIMPLELEAKINEGKTKTEEVQVKFDIDYENMEQGKIKPDEDIRMPDTVKEKTEKVKIMQNEAKTETTEDKVKQEKVKIMPHEGITATKEHKIMSDEEKAKIEEDKIKTDHGQVKLDKVKIISDTVKTETKGEKNKPEEVKIMPDEGKVKIKEVTILSGEIFINDTETNKINLDEDISNEEEDKAKTEEVKIKSDEVKTKEEKEKVKPERVKTQTDESKTGDSKTQTDEQKNQPIEAKVQTDEIKITPDNIKSRLEDIKASLLEIERTSTQIDIQDKIQEIKDRLEEVERGDARQDRRRESNSRRNSYNSSASATNDQSEITLIRLPSKESSSMRHIRRKELQSTSTLIPVTSRTGPPEDDEVAIESNLDVEGARERQTNLLRVYQGVKNQPRMMRDKDSYVFDAVQSKLQIDDDTEKVQELVRSETQSDFFNMAEVYHKLRLGPGEEFRIALECLANGYWVRLNEELFCAYPDTVHYSRISHIAIDGDVDIEEIDVGGGKGKYRTLVVSLYAAVKWSSDVVVVTDRNFSEIVLSSDMMWMLNLYAPWCPACARLQNQWEYAAQRLKGKVRLGAADCDRNEQLSDDMRVEYNPVIKYFPKGRKSIKSARIYEGNRTADAIVKWAKFTLDGGVGLPLGTRPRGNLPYTLRKLKNKQILIENLKYRKLYEKSAQDLSWHKGECNESVYRFIGVDIPRPYEITIKPEEEQVKRKKIKCYSECSSNFFLTGEVQPPNRKNFVK